MEAFVYCWTDFGTNKLYVGVHKGTPDDGYVCSSKPMLEEHTKRPNDFSREIIARGTFADCYALETAILKSAKADKNPEFYNLSTNSPRAPEHHTEESKKRMSRSRLEYMNKTGQDMRRENHPMWGTKHSKQHCEKIRLALAGKKRSLKAKTNAGKGRAGFYQITTPQGGILCVRGLVKFCRLYKLHLSNMFNRGVCKRFLCKKLVNRAN